MLAHTFQQRSDLFKCLLADVTGVDLSHTTTLRHAIDREQPLKGISCAIFVSPERLDILYFCTRPIVGNESFVVLLAEDLIALAVGQCIRWWIHLKSTVRVFFVLSKLPSETDKYSIVEITADNGTVVNISEIVETLQA